MNIEEKIKHENMALPHTQKSKSYLAFMKEDCTITAKDNYLRISIHHSSNFNFIV